MSGKRVLVGGGARSGKSAFALAHARRLGKRRVYLATAEAGDEEMAGRIERHREERGSEFETVEAPRNVTMALERVGNADVVVVDCLTLWLSNLLCDGRSEAEAQEEVDRFADLLADRGHHTIVVTNEVGMGVVPETPLGRAFRDVCGRAHQRLARDADEIYFGALGMILRLRPDPVRVEAPVA